MKLSLFKREYGFSREGVLCVQLNVELLRHSASLVLDDGLAVLLGEINLPCHVLKFVYTILWYSIFFSLSGMPDKLKSFLLYCYRLSLG